MSRRHCLVVFPGPPAAAAGVADGPYVTRWRLAQATHVAVSVFADGDDVPVVLVSAASRSDKGWVLTVLLGFASDPLHGNQMRQDGAAVIDATLRSQRTDDRLEVDVVAPYFADGELAIRADGGPLLHIDLPQAALPRGKVPQASTAVRFTLETVMPDPVANASQVLLQQVDQPSFGVQQMPGAQAHVAAAAGLRFPDLGRLIVGAGHGVEVWQGDPDDPAAGGVAGPKQGVAPRTVAPAVRRALRQESPYGPPRFVFEDVELFGFRVAPSLLTPDRLEKLVEPLNAYVRATDLPGAPDYRYETASATLVVELLRYGRMRCASPQLPLTAADYTCQHELIVRVLTGRVDDDTSQAREAASFVPAIFVDEPWSKALGRELEGYPKELARFHGPGGQLLASDGRVVGGGATPVELQQVTAVRPPTAPGQPEAAPFFEVDYSGAAFDHPFEELDLRLLAAMPFGRWRQEDFEDRRFSRSFARAVMKSGFAAFETVQVCPVGLPKARRQARIRGGFVSSMLRWQMPVGLCDITLRPVAGLETTTSGLAWNELIRLLAGNGATEARVSCVTGDWYRTKCNARMRIEDSI